MPRHPEAARVDSAQGMEATYTLATAILIGFGVLVVARFVPRCPECGSFWVSQMRGVPYRVCDRCQTVWRDPMKKGD